MDQSWYSHAIHNSYMKLQKFGAKSETADSCFGLIGLHQCSAALACTQVHYTCAWPHALITRINIALVQSQEAKRVFHC